MSGPLNRGGIADLPFIENTIRNFPKIPESQVSGK